MIPSVAFGIILLLASTLGQIEENERRPAICKSPNGEKGTCVPFLECELFKKLLENGANKLSDKQKQFLRASECKQRKDGEFPMICCGTATNFKE
ncbi:hypothetical protein HUJ05_001180 [Dendroctonus ponderosae]|nr:hypothetical protein HUJ05_001180 [Dendroctonus ponderosae]